MATLPSVILDRYTIERELGRGGMATVYLAHDRRHDRQVAIKVLHSDLLTGGGTERFVREIRIAAQLTHPHILPLLDSGEAGGHPYYVMPFVSGDSLRARLSREGAFPVDEAVRVTIAVGRALEYAHGMGIVHRDIKPENVLMASGEAMVADFGIARAISAAADDRLTQSGVAIGTPVYMSPEQASGEREVDGRTDIYSLAVMLYELLAGEPPYTGPTAQAITARKLASDPPSVRVVRPLVPVGVEEAMRRGLAVNPADRFRTARDFADALESAVRTSLAGQAAPAPLRLRRAAQRLWRSITAWRALAVVGTAGIAALLTWPRNPNEGTGQVRNLVLPTGVLSVTNHGPAPVVAISPDGKYIAYVVGVGGAGQVYLRRLDAPTAVAVPNAAQGYAPFFSPDGRWLAFADASRGQSETVLRKVRIADGEQATICLAPDLHGATWLPDDRIVLGGTANNGYSLSIVSANGGKPEVLARPDSAVGDVYYIYPSALPDGAAVLFVSAGGGGLARSVNVLDLSSRKQHKLLDGGGNAVALPDGMLVYAAENALYAAEFNLRSRRLSGLPHKLHSDVLMGLPFEPALGHYAIGGDGTLAYLAGNARSFRGASIGWLDSAGHTTAVLDEARFPAALGGGPMDIAGVRATSRGDRFTFWSYRLGRDTSRIGYPPADAWLYDARSATLSRVFPGVDYFWPVWSPDGEWIVAPHADDSLRATALYRRRVDGRGAPERLTAPVRGKWQIPYDLSRDGRLLFYILTQEDAKADAYVLAVDGDRTPRRLLAAEGSVYSPTLSPDGRWLAYAKADAKGKLQVFVVDYPTLRQSRQVTFDGGETPAWTADGHWIFFSVEVSGGDRQIQRVTFDGTRDPPAGRPVRFAGRPHLSPFAEPFFGRSFDVSPDGRRLLLGNSLVIGKGRVDTTAVSALTVIVNWREAVRRALRP